MSARESRGKLDSLRRLNDEELARVAAGGDEAAARVLLERFEEPLYRYTLARVRDPDLAREATWSALFEAARAVRMDDYSEPVRPWLFRVAHTAADVAGGRPNGIVENDEAVTRAAAAGGEDGERLEQLLAGLDELPDDDRSALLLRELVGIEYTGIATVMGTRASTARQSVFHARLALQGNPDPPTDHCDEIRAAMSKAEYGVRERRSIAVHLETCPVCDEFARQLETRPDDLRTLFPAPEEPLAAELVPPLPPIDRGATQPLPAVAPVEEGGERRRRRWLIPAAIALVLIGAGVATALVLNDNGGGEKGKARASHETTLGRPPSERKAPETSPEGEKKAPAAGAKAGAEKGGAAAKPEKGGAAAKPEKGGAASKSEEGGATEKGGAAAPGAESEAGKQAEQGGAAGEAEEGGATAETERGAEAGAAEREVPRTGLDVSLIVALGLLMLAVGVSLRRVYAEL